MVQTKENWGLELVARGLGYESDEYYSAGDNMFKNTVRFNIPKCRGRTY